MSAIAYVNGRYLSHRTALVHIEDRGYQFSDGVYEYIAFYHRRLLDGDLHFKRLERSCRELQIALPVSAAAMAIIVRELIARNGREDGGLYIQVTRGVARRDHPFPKHVKPALVITVGASRLPKEHDVQHGVKIITSPDLRWARRDIKSISLLANVLAKQEAAKQHMREAWLTGDDGIVCEGAASNAFIVTPAGAIVTHHIHERILGGVTRDVVLRLARKASIAVEERPFHRVKMRQAAEAFLTSTSAHVLPVVTIDDHRVGNGRVGPVTRQLQELYYAHIFRQTGKQL